MKPSIKQGRATLHIALPAMWLVSGAAILLVVFVIPWHMDEWIMYHVLACWQPSQALNVYRESCAAYPISLGPLQFQRSYAYVGIASSLLMAPFHALTSSMWTPYVVGAGFLILTAVGVLKSLALSIKFTPLILIFFPLLYTVLHDGGPVRLGLTALAWTPVIAARYLQTRGTARFLWLAFLTVIWVVATEDKPFFLYLVPGIVVFTLAALSARGLMSRARDEWQSLGLLFAIATTASLGLLGLLRVDGQAYLQFLASSSPELDLLDRLCNAVNGILLTIDWPFYAQRVVSYAPFGPGNPQDAGIASKIAGNAAYLPGFASASAAIATTATIVVIAGVITLYVVAARRQLRSETSRPTTLLLIAAAVTLWLGATISGGWASHHFVYAQVPLVGLLAYGLAQRQASLMRTFTLLLALAGLSVAAVWLTPTAPTASREIRSVVDQALDSADSNSVINCSSWGCYYTYSYANENQVPIVFADNADNAALLESWARESGRRIFHICVDCVTDSVAAMYPHSLITQVPTGTSTWYLFTVEPSLSPVVVH